MSKLNLEQVSALVNFYKDATVDWSSRIELLVGQIKRSVTSIEKSRFVVAMSLFLIKKELANCNGGFLFHGNSFNDVYDFSEKNFGFGKTSTKNAISVIETYFNELGILQYQFEGYKYCQLVELLPLVRGGSFDGDYRNYTVLEIRQLKKSLLGQTSDKIEEDDGDICGLDYITNAPAQLDAADSTEDDSKMTVIDYTTYNVSPLKAVGAEEHVEELRSQMSDQKTISSDFESENFLYNTTCSTSEYLDNFYRLGVSLDMKNKIDLVEMVCLLLPAKTSFNNLRALERRLNDARKEGVYLETQKTGGVA